jgi:hypothetical protein
MTSDRETLRVIESWMEDGRTRLPDHVLEAVLDQLPTSPQRRPAWPTRITSRSAFGRWSIAAAAVLIVSIAGFNVLGPNLDRPGGFGAQPSPSPLATPRPLHEGTLKPGTYVAHPLPAPNGELSVIYTVPAAWEAVGDAGLIPVGDPTTAGPGGMAIQFLEITSLNSNPCEWAGTDDDVSFGRTVDDLVQALRAQTRYEVSDPVDIAIGGYSGRRVDIEFPTEVFEGQTSTARGCDDDRIRPWNTSAHGEGGVYAQGPSNRWQTNVLDVQGTRLVVVVQDFPGTRRADRAELNAIVASLVIEP